MQTLLLQWAQKIAPRLPEAPAGLVLSEALNQLAPHLWRGEDFAWLQHRTVRLYVTDLGFGVTLGHSGQRFTWSNAAAQVTLSAALADYRCMLRGEADPDTLFFQRRLALEGDTALGLYVKNWLDATDRDALLELLPAFAGRWLRPTRF